jgi:hypothetical protein
MGAAAADPSHPAHGDKPLRRRLDRALTARAAKPAAAQARAGG